VLLGLKEALVEFIYDLLGDVGGIKIVPDEELQIMDFKSCGTQQQNSRYISIYALVMAFGRSYS
jgi:hypothetical protein